MLKRCGSCQKEKPLSEFWVNRRDGGHQSMCKSCKAKWRTSQKGKASSARACAKWGLTERGQESIRQASERFRSTERGRVLDAATARRAKRRHPDREQARAALRNAVASGKLRRPSVCSSADGSCRGRIEAHHHNGYDQAHWLDVVWLCTGHHRIADERTRLNNPALCLPDRKRKLTTADVSRIRELHSNGVTRTEIARRFGVSFQAVNGIVKGARWATTPSESAE